MLGAERSPISQKSMPCNRACGASVSKRLTTAPKAATIATPVAGADGGSSRQPEREREQRAGGGARAANAATWPATRPGEEDPDHRAERRAARNAQNRRVGKRVAQQDLQQHAGNREQPPTANAASTRGTRNPQTISRLVSLPPPATWRTTCAGTSTERQARGERSDEYAAPRRDQRRRTISGPRVIQGRLKIDPATAPGMRAQGFIGIDRNGRVTRSSSGRSLCESL